MRRFGFGKPTGIDLPGEERGIVLPLAKYSGSSMGNLPIGQGIAVTPLQMAAAYAAIANGGILRAAAHRREGQRPAVAAAPGHADHLRGDRRLAAQDARGRARPGRHRVGAAIKGYQLAGKTGTAQKPDPVTGGYSQTSTSRRSWASRPPAARSCSSPWWSTSRRATIYGGLVAAPAWKEITSFALNYLRIPPG